MTEPDNAKSETYSLYQKHLDIIQNHKKNKKFNSNAASLQNIIETFNRDKKISMYKNILILLIYPAIFCIFINYGARVIQGTMKKLISKGYTDIGELGVIEVTYTSFGFISLGVLAMCMIFLYALWRREDGN